MKIKNGLKIIGNSKFRKMCLKSKKITHKLKNTPTPKTPVPCFNQNNLLL